MSTKRAIFLDRDGTLIREVAYLSRLEEVKILEQAASAVSRINRAGILAVVITNQSGVARGLLSEERLREINRSIARSFARRGACLDAFYYCPHHPGAGLVAYRQSCRCRKPQPGLLLEAAQELGIDLRRSCMVGDRLVDVQAGRSVGCTSVLVKTGLGMQELANWNGAPDRSGIRPDFVATDLLEAVQWMEEMIF